MRKISNQKINTQIDFFLLMWLPQHTLHLVSALCVCVTGSSNLNHQDTEKNSIIVQSCCQGAVLPLSPAK